MSYPVESIKLTEAWVPDSDTVQSFAHGYRACRLRGPARLVRLLSHAGRAPEGQIYGPNRLEGSYWFEERDLERLRRLAHADLKATSGPGEKSGPSYRLGMSLRIQLRDLLAIRRDWTPSFDYRVILALPTGAALVALVGQIRGQPVYSEHVDGADGAAKAGITLPGGLVQYVIDFEFPANRSGLRFIGNPMPL